MNKKQKSKEVIKALSDEIRVEKKVHKGYTEWLKAKRFIKKGENKFKLKQIFGKYHYIYSSPKGMISLIELKKYDILDKKDMWEIYELSKNNLFNDVLRFNSKEQAVKRIKGLLE